MLKRNLVRNLILASIILFILIALQTFTLPALAVVYPFTDNMEDATTGNWKADAPWGQTTEFTHGGQRAYTDSPNGNYANSIDVSLKLASNIDLRKATVPVLSFWHRYALQANKDYGYVEVSTDNGTKWTALLTFTGSQLEWTKVIYDLTNYVTQSGILIRFRINTDGSETADGWYIDDVRIGGSEVSISYPFFDDMEDQNKNNWMATGSWGLVSTAYNGNFAWTDSPVGNYPDSATIELILANTLDLSNAANPQLVFWHRYETYNSDDKCHVQVSGEGGVSNTYETLGTFWGNQKTWTRAQFDLSPYSGRKNIRVRFLLTSNSWSNSDGWYIDDIKIGDSLPVITLTLTSATMHSADLSWTKVDNPQFASYEIYRGAKSGGGYSLVKTIENASTTTYRDEYAILEPDTYLYTLRVVNKQGIPSVSSNAVEARYTVPKASYPFSDDFEQGTGRWEWGIPWGLTSESAHGGKMSWTDSPGEASANNANTALTLRIDLRTAKMPLMRFWHRYSLEQNADYGYVEASIDQGKNWAQLLLVTGLLRDWSEVRLDLTRYATQTDVRVRFRVKTNETIVQDGWYIDDFRIDDNNAKPTYPFLDNIEDQNTVQSNWSSSAWGIVSDAHSGSAAWTDSPKGNYNINSQESLNLLVPIDLSRAAKPQLVFWHHYVTERNSDYCNVQVSTDMGQNYSTLAQYSGEQKEWSQAHVDLSKYIGLPMVWIRFLLTSDSYSIYDGWYIDDVQVDEALPDVVLNEPANVSMHSATLKWSASANRTGFSRYEIYRAAEDNVTRSSMLAASIEDPSVTTYRDEYNILEPNYYRYRVYAVGKNGISSLGSNVVNANYTLPKVKYPFRDDLESGSKNWEWGGSWGLTDQFAYSGNMSWTDSPQSGYGSNAESALTLRVDLDKAMTPGLLFWHRCSLEPNADYVYVEVSNDGAKTWKTLRAITGHLLDWENVTVNLFSYAGQFDIHIRFRIKTNDKVTFDGWYIDDIRIEEVAAAEVTLISYDMENSDATKAKWTTTSWGLASPGHNSETAWTDSPAGNYTSNANSSLRLSAPLDLSKIISPKLVFWHFYTTESSDDFCYVEISKTGADSGYVALGRYSGTQSDWKEVQMDLSDYEGAPKVWVQFRLTSDYSSQYDGWHVDDIRINGFQMGPDQSFEITPGFVILQPGLTQQFAISKTTGIVWSVNDVAGGNQKLGTISERGLYTAPKEAPDPSTVTIKVAQTNNPARFATATVTISKTAKPRGDANGDGKVDALDITALERIIAGLDTASPNASPDVDGNNQINIYDITELERIIYQIKPAAAPPVYSGNPKLNLSVITTEYNTIILELKALDIRNLDTVYFEFASDRSNCQILEVSAGDMMAGVEPVVDLKDNGTRGAVVINLPGLNGVSGSGVLARLRIKTETEEPCQFVLSRLAIGDIYGQQIPIHTERLSVTWPKVPEYNELLQNFPNPFNPETWIPYNLSKPANVKIVIHDLSGRVVREMDLGLKIAGSYLGRNQAAYWDGRNQTGEAVGSGIYFYTIQADSYIATRKMIVLR